MIYKKLLKLDWLDYAYIYSALRGTVRQKHDVLGNTTTFSGPNGPVDCNLEQYFVGDWCENAKETLNNPTVADMTSMVTALNMNRKANKLIVDAICNSEHEYATGDMLDIGTLCDVLQKDVQEEFHAVVCFQQWELIKKLAKTGDKDIEESEPWMGIHWHLISDLPEIDGKRRCFIYHRDAIGFADSGQFEVDATWHGERAQYFINTSLKMGACVINPAHIYEIDCQEGE